MNLPENIKLPSIKSMAKSIGVGIAIVAVKQAAGEAAYNIKNVAIVRIEQLFPLPVKLIISEIKKFSNAKDIVWAQEEPRNMGAWNHIQTYHPIAKNMRPATRRFYGSTASGSFTRFERRHNQVIEYVFDKTKNNFRK